MRNKQIRVLFIHHSTGGLLLRFGNVRKLLRQKAPGIEFWDHGYNYDPSWIAHIFKFKTGLSDQHGKILGKDFDIVLSNDSPKEYAEIFSRRPIDSTLKSILAFDVIIFKNCFPTTRIESDEKLEQHKKYYAQIITSISTYKNLFIVFTPPPLRNEKTKPEWALRARELANWLRQQEKDNIKVFDFFDALADKKGPNANMLRRSYCWPIIPDSHPNIKACQEVGKTFVDFLGEVISSYT